MLLAPSLLQAARLLSDLAGAFAEVGLCVHFGKTKFMSNVAQRRGFWGKLQKVPIKGSDVEILRLDETIGYLGRCLTFGQYHGVEVANRINKAGRSSRFLRGNFGTGVTRWCTG